MRWVLVSNDDGVDSPALLPFADAVGETLGLPVRVCVPAGERSWSSKAVTRRGTVHTELVSRGGRELVTVDGTPADAVQLGLHHTFAGEFGGAPPAALVTGINLGYNSGTAFLASSGTVWAAAEGAFAGVSAIAVSTGPTATDEDFAQWRSTSTQPDAAPRWDQLAQVAAAIASDVLDSDLHQHCDLVSVNMPWDANRATPRAVTQLTPLAYGPLFLPGEDGCWRFTTELEIELGDAEADGDVAALTDGRISITPVVLPGSATVPAAVRDAVERR